MHGLVFGRFRAAKRGSIRELQSMFPSGTASAMPTWHARRSSKKHQVDGVNQDGVRCQPLRYTSSTSQVILGMWKTVMGAMRITSRYAGSGSKAAPAAKGMAAPLQSNETLEVLR